MSIKRQESSLCKKSFKVTGQGRSASKKVDLFLRSSLSSHQLHTPLPNLQTGECFGGTSHDQVAVVECCYGFVWQGFGSGGGL